MASRFASSPQGAVLSNPRFLKLWIGQIISALGDSVAYMGLSFLILYKLNGTALDVGKMMIAASIPTLLLGPIAGVFVDRWSRRRVMVVADIVRGAIYLAMPFVTSLTWVYAGIFCASVMSRFFYPAKSAIVPSLVAKGELMVASGLNQTSGSIVSILGPAVGGALAGTLGPSITMYANAASFFVSAILIAAIRLDERRATAGTAKSTGAVGAVWHQLAEGIRFALSHPSVRFYTTMFALFMLCIGGVNVLFIAFAKDVLGFSITQIGWTESTQAIGGLLGGIVTTMVAARFRPTRLIFGSVVVTGLALAVIGANRVPGLVYLLIAVIGVALAAVNIPFGAEMMRLIPNEMRGRVWAAFGSATEGCSLVSMAVMPAIAMAVGLVPVFVAMGLGVAVLGLLAMGLSGRMLREPVASQVSAPAAQ